MAVTYGFFNSVNGDRKYNADQMSEYFRGIVSPGVFQHLDSGLAVSAGTGLAVSVAAGRAIIQDRWIQNSAALNLTISAASESYGRKDAVVIRLDKSSRAISITVKTGTPAASPAAPEMTRSGGVYEMALAYVNVAAGATSVTVTDKRSDSAVCGWAAVAQATSGEVDQMLNDMKTGFDGDVYSSPAEMVQGEDQKLKDEIDIIAMNAVSKNMVGKTPNCLYPHYVPAGSKVTMSTSDGSQVDQRVRFSFYNKNGTLVDYCSFLQGETQRTYQWSAEKGDFYFVSHDYTGSKSLQIEIGDTKTTYTDYFPTVIGANNLIKQNSIEIYTQPERPIRITNSGQNITVTIPEYFFLVGYELSQTFIHKTEQTFTIPHNSLLVFHNDTEEFEVVTQNWIKATTQKITILLFNSGGVARGQWAKYQYDAGEYYSDPNALVKGVNHQGFNTIAPANNLLAYIESKKQGFTYVETDVQFTSDGVPVLLHDTTINSVARNADGTTLSSDVYIADITYEQALQYDFGIYKGEQFAGTKISRFDDFIKLCKFLSLKPYIDSSLASDKIAVLFDIIDDYNMRGNVTFISGVQETLDAVKAIDPDVRVGYYPSTVDSSVVEYILGFNNGFIDLNHSNVTTTIISLLKAARIPLEVWTIDNASSMKLLNPYISGVTSNSQNYDRVMKQDYLKSKPIYVV